MKSKRGLFALGIFAAAMAGAVTAYAQAPGWGTTPVFPSVPVVGEHQNLRNLYRLRCGVCHGGNGEGTNNDYPRLAPALKGNPFIQHAPSAAIIAVIRKGRTGPQRLYHESYPNMPAFGAEAVPDADALVQFLKTDLQQ
ncbi:MAG TPA: cytochrome c [Usitatibacter sp.]|nr:cytochrome c [Usitatibacter sp.]